MSNRLLAFICGHRFPWGVSRSFPVRRWPRPDTFQCTVIGRGGHAAIPHETVDPVVVGAQIVTAMQTIVSRSVDPLDNVVVSVTQFIAGTAFNVIPESVYISGTIRTFDATLRDSVPQLLERIIGGVTSAFGATYTLSIERGYRPVVNDVGTHSQACRCCRENVWRGYAANVAPQHGR